MSTDAVLFLDIDGVLAPFDGDGTLDTACVARLEALVRRAGATVVISSAWRHRYGLDELHAKLAAAGYRGAIAGVTPTLLDGSRSDEIRAWIEREGSRLPFVVLDDAQPTRDLRPRWILTDESLGLQDDDVARALALLGVADEE
jgi:hypothetical protein